MPTSLAARAEHHRWLADLTALPTASGKEQRVIAWIRAWCAARPEVVLNTDPSGNLHLALKGAQPAERPVYFTAHLDHPAFVVERVVSPTSFELSFRGGVMDEYFINARVMLHDAKNASARGKLAGEVKPEKADPAYKYYTLTLDTPMPSAAVGDVAVWDVGPAEVIEGCMHTLGCDDLSAVAASLAAFDELLGVSPRPDVRILFTRAEEIGFVGAIAACRHRTMPLNARVIALENSRSFVDSPIGGGPIVRVGDRLSIFSPSLTDAIGKRAEQIAGGAAPTASQKLSSAPAWKWQRKLMAGGACEASVYCAYGYEATCVCLPLGNYHNMADLAAVQAGTNTAPPKVGREYISVADFDGMVDLLIACGVELPAAGGFMDRLDKLWNDKNAVLKP